MKLAQKIELRSHRMVARLPVTHPPLRLGRAEQVETVKKPEVPAAAPPVARRMASPRRW